MHPCEEPCGTTRTLAGWNPTAAQHHVPTPLRSTVITRFFATTRALTPAGPFATDRGSLIHVTRTSEHSISKSSADLRQPRSTPSALAALFCCGLAGAMPSRQFRRPNRVHFVPYAGIVVTDCSFISSCSPPGLCPAQLLFNYWPSVSARSGLSPCCSGALSGAHSRRFNAGQRTKERSVPKGRPRATSTLSRPFGRGSPFRLPRR